MPVAEPVILGIDPGHRKCGLACLTADGKVVAAAIVPTEILGEVLARYVANHDLAGVVVGDGTHSREVLAAAEPIVGEAAAVVVRDEVGTTLLARARYWCEHRPRGLWRLVPTSMRVPPEPYDDAVAALLAERRWRELRGTE